MQTLHVKEESDAEPKIAASQLANVCPWKVWDNSDFHKVVWSVKLVRKKGFQPVRPFVIFSQALTIPPEMALQTTK